MPRAPKVCATPGCPHPQPCPDHRPKPWAGSTRRKRLPKNWNRITRRILRRDPMCKVCGVAPSVEVDHIQRGDDHSPGNLQGICKRCHAIKSSREGNAAKA